MGTGFGESAEELATVAGAGAPLRGIGWLRRYIAPPSEFAEEFAMEGEEEAPGTAATSAPLHPPFRSPLDPL
eukprot:1444548-Pyramimonas_sp.AAC.1